MTNETTMTGPNDHNGQTCTKCGIGYYYETSIHDDWDGVLHCNNKKCNHEVKRYKSDDNPEPAVEKAKLSPAAQAVLDASSDAPVGEGWNADRLAIAAALRAAADQVVPEEYSARYPGHSAWQNGCTDANKLIRRDLIAIAAELEGGND